MNKKILASAVGLMFVVTPFTMAQAENINIYGWQNWSYEWVDADNGREVDRLSNNAANIGFMSHMDTGIPGLQVGLRCEQFTYWGRNNVYTDWCNRNSKISLRHETMGELMFGQWLLPFNEIVAQWIDPFYDAGADSHTSIMGNLGGNAGGIVANLFYNGSFDDDFGDASGALAFNRRQEGVIQYVWPNTSAMASQARDGFQFRFAITEGSNTDKPSANGTLDERIWSTGASWQHNMGGNQIWLAAAYEQHDDVSAEALGGNGTNPFGPSQVHNCDDSDDNAWRLAGRYIHDWGNGMKTQVGAMWEELEYDADNCSEADYGGDIGMSKPVWADVDREAWMVSGKHTFGNGFDVRFSYMDADEWDCGSESGDACALREDDTEAEAYNIGLFYTMPAGTELRVTYSEVDNDDHSAYDFGINGGFPGEGNDIDMFAVGIVHWFD